MGVGKKESYLFRSLSQDEVRSLNLPELSQPPFLKNRRPLMPYLTVNDCTLYYETAGEGSPVVYVHGGFASLDTTLRDLTPYNWDWEQNFARQFHFIAYDRRGCYRSSSPETGYDLATQARDLAGLLDSLNIPAVHLIGSSAGGPIAIVFAAQWPQRVRSLVLVGTAL